eukprot:gene16153-21956_t
MENTSELDIPLSPFSENNGRNSIDSDHNSLHKNNITSTDDIEKQNIHQSSIVYLEAVDIENCDTKANINELLLDNNKQVFESSSKDKDNNDDSYNVSYGSSFYISVPWSPQIYFTVRGSENFHIYLWIAKDLSWSQNLYWCSMIFGSMALSWCLVLAYHAISSRCYEEVYMLIPLIIWLSANFVWMAGEVFNGDDDIVVPRSAIMMEVAIAWILFYHIVLRPLKLLPADELMTRRYSKAGLNCRFSYFQNWRQYEHAHTLCWLGKDLSWNQLNPYFWIICLIPTVTIAMDFIWTTHRTKRMAIDTAHYIAQLIWVLGNFTWALGNIFVNRDGDDNAFEIFHMSRAAAEHCRWYASWVLLFAYLPILCLYFIWLPLTCVGKIKAADIPQNQT